MTVVPNQCSGDAEECQTSPAKTTNLTQIWKLASGYISMIVGFSNPFKTKNTQEFAIVFILQLPCNSHMAILEIVILR